MELIGYILIFYLTHILASQGLTIVSKPKGILTIISASNLIIGLLLPTIIILFMYFSKEYRLSILVYLFGLAIFTCIVSIISLVKVVFFRTAYFITPNNFYHKTNRRIIFTYILTLVVIITLWTVLYDDFGIQKN